MLIESFEREGRWATMVRIYTWLSVISTITVIVISFVFVPRSTPFWMFEPGDVVNLLTSLILISLFIERANGIILIAWRNQDREEVKLRKKRIERQIQNPATDSGLRADLEYRVKILGEYIEMHTAHTTTIALLTALGFGVVIAALGIRVLEPLVDPAVFEGLSHTQHKLFVTADVFLTGALLGGGADGIYRIMDLFLSTVDAQREKVKERMRNRAGDLPEE